jgi:hypothetical protein
MRLLSVKTSVSDLQTRIRMQHFMSMRIHIRVRIQIQIQGFDEKELKTNLLLKFLCYKNFYFFIKYVQATGEAFSPQKRTSSTYLSLKRGHPALQKTFFNFCGSFLPSWIRIRPKSMRICAMVLIISGLDPPSSVIISMFIS